MVQYRIDLSMLEFACGYWIIVILQYTDTARVCETDRKCSDKNLGLHATISCSSIRQEVGLADVKVSILFTPELNDVEVRRQPFKNCSTKSEL